MKTLALFLLALPLPAQILAPLLYGASSGGAAACTPAAGYSHCRALTLDHTQVPSTQTNFPAVVWNGFTLGSSRIQNASCFDVIFTSDSVGSTKIPWEVESCTQSTGAMVVWFLVSSLSSSVDTKIYVHYQNAAITTAQNTGGNAPTAVWDANFKAVWHLGNGVSLSGADSTTNASTLTTITSSVTATTGTLDGGALFNSTGNYAGTLAGFGSAQTAITASGWINIDSTYSDGSFGLPLYNTGNILYFQINGLRQIQFTVNAGGVPVAQICNTVLTKGVWYYVTGTYDGTNTNIYINGAQDNSGSPMEGTGTIATFSTIQLGGNSFIGIADEFKISNSARSANWVTVQYNNQRPSSTFISVGSEV